MSIFKKSAYWWNLIFFLASLTEILLQNTQSLVCVQTILRDCCSTEIWRVFSKIILLYLFIYLFVYLVSWLAETGITEFLWILLHTLGNGVGWVARGLSLPFLLHRGGGCSAEPPLHPVEEARRFRSGLRSRTKGFLCGGWWLNEVSWHSIGKGFLHQSRSTGKAWAKGTMKK